MCSGITSKEPKTIFLLFLSTFRRDEEWMETNVSTTFSSSMKAHRPLFAQWKWNLSEASKDFNFHSFSLALCDASSFWKCVKIHGFAPHISRDNAFSRRNKKKKKQKPVISNLVNGFYRNEWQSLAPPPTQQLATPMTMTTSSLRPRVIAVACSTCVYVACVCVRLNFSQFSIWIFIFHLRQKERKNNKR